MLFRAINIRLEKGNQNNNNNNLKLVYEYNEDGTITLKADRNKISQVISNLLSNAIKFTRRRNYLS